MDYTPEQLRNSAGYTEALLVKRGLELVTVEAVGHIEQLRAHAAKIEECERYRGALEEIREVWAGSEAGEPIHAQEAYAIQLCKQQYQLACEALKEPQ